MCGISGFVSTRLATEARASAVRRMCEAMVHRGPDDAGMESVGPATIGMRRLAIFDPANGHQPMVSANGRFTLVFNGAIYNFKTIRAALTTVGHTFRTECDTEVLLAAFVQWGERCLGRLQGMFAFAVWDSQESKLFLARDPFGIKPLYFQAEPGADLLFASELNALLASGHCPREIDPAAVSEYLGSLSVPAPRTIYRGIASLCPGECATWQNGNLSVRRYWHFPKPQETMHQARSRPEFIRQLRAKLEDTIRAHSVADVPVGAFLSGGLDSCVVVGLMTQLTGAHIKTFSIGFAETDYSEADLAAQTARFYGCEHTPVQLTGAQVASDLGRIVGLLDQPTGDGINTFYASQAARAGGVTVALSGLGGDELFGGYPSFRDVPRLARWLPWWRKLPRGLRARVTARLGAGDTRGRKLAQFLTHAGSLAEVNALQRRVFTLDASATILAAGHEPGSPFHPRLPELQQELWGQTDFNTVSGWELSTYMADVLLRDSDVMSMANSLELRVPFVHEPFIHWLWNQPAAYKVDLRHPKSALAEAVQDILPADIMTRRKRGFTLPFPFWMKAELRGFLEETFSNASIQKSGLFSTDGVQAYWNRFLAGSDHRDWSRVWSLAVLIAFINRPQPR